MTFQVFPEDRGLVMARPDRAVVLPGAFELEGHYIGMPHDLDHCIRLASQGYTPPSPIEYYYNWPHDAVIFPKIFDHQIKTAGFLCNNPRAYCLNQIGTMKTITALWAADYLMSIGQIGPVLIVAPLESLERAWGDTLFFHLPHRKYVILHGSAARRKKLLATKADFYIINLDGLSVVKKELAERKEIRLFIVDELADFRNQHNGWRALQQLIYPDKGPAVPWVWGLTGTPTPQSPTDAYHQCKLLTPKTVPRYFSQFRALTMNHQSTYVWTPRDEATKIVYQAMRPAIRYTRDQCLDLPGEIVTPLDVELSSEQAKHYKDVLRELYTEIQNKKITAVNEGVKLSKLLQIACGVVYTSDGSAVEIDCGERLELLLRTIERVQEKVIVFVPFTEVTNMLHREISKHWSCAVVYGEVGHGERNRIFSDFQNKEDPSVLVAHPGCMSRSLTLTEASTIIWYAPIDSNYTYEQACGRITRQGQKYVANIIHIAGSPIERRSYKRLAARQNLQGVLLEMVEKGEEL